MAGRVWMEVGPAKRGFPVRALIIFQSPPEIWDVQIVTLRSRQKSIFYIFPGDGILPDMLQHRAVTQAKKSRRDLVSTLICAI